jgi:hypothetical protein
VRDPAVQTPTALAALAVAGINDVLNGEAYTLAAWRNRIPTAPWVFMAVIAVCCNILIGSRSAPARGQFSFFLILPFVAAIAFMLIADLDSPRGGFIQVVPQNLVSLSEALRR